MDRTKDDALEVSSGKQQQDGVNSCSHWKEKDSSEGDKVDGKSRKVSRKKGSKSEDQFLIGSTDIAERPRQVEDSLDGSKLAENWPTIPEESGSTLKDEELIGPLRGQQRKADRARKTQDSLDDSKMSGIYPKFPETPGIEPVDELKDEALTAVGKHDTDTQKTDATKGDAKSEKDPKLPGKRKRKPKDGSRKQQSNVESPRKTEGLKSRTTLGKPRNHGLFKFTKRVKTFGGSVKRLWDIWSRFKTRNQEPNPTAPDKTLGVPGFEEIACIEAEVPDIMMTDKDRVRTSCKECMQDPPAFPSKEQVKAKLIAADKYYGVRDAKSRAHADSLEHEADYYDVDGTVVRPSWRFILERPLVEQYVLMTNYIRKVSVISELKSEKESIKFVEEEDSGSDTEYKKFEQKLIHGRRELLKPILKPKTQEIAVQTSFAPEPTAKELGEFSEISLYPESEESTNSPEVSAVTIVTSRDYSSPLQSDFDGRTTDKSASYKGGSWWECQGSCQPSESFQTSRDSANNVSSGSDGQSIPVRAAWGETCLRSESIEPSNEEKWIVTSQRIGKESTTSKIKDLKKVRFSPVVTFYQGPEKNGAVYEIPEDVDDAMDSQTVELQQNTQVETPTSELTEVPEIVEELKPPEAKPKPPTTLMNILKERKGDQIVSVSLPKGWHEDRILRNTQKVNVAVSRGTAGNRPLTKKISFQRFNEIPDLQFSNPQISPIRETTEAYIQTHTPASEQRGKAATTSRQMKLTTLQSVYAQSEQTQKPVGLPEHNQKITQQNLDLTSRRNDHQVMESVGTGTNIQSMGKSQVIPRQKSSNAHHGPPTRLQFSNPQTQNQSSKSQPSWGFGKEVTQKTNDQPIQHGTQSNLELKNKQQITGSRTLSDPSISDRLLPKTKALQPSQKYQISTDTEGSSTSNDHIKLKASPACFFKVATPTDLSKISVDDFYPEVPEIDAELSKNSDLSVASPPKVELVLENPGTALKSVPDDYFRNRRITGKEENAILQSCAIPSKTIMVSQGIEIRGSTDAAPSKAVSSKAPAVADIESSCKTIKPPKKESFVPKKAPRTTNVKQEAMLEGVKQILSSKPGRKSEMLSLKDAQSSSLGPQKQEPKLLKQQQTLATIRGGLNIDKIEESRADDEVMRKAQKSHRQLVSSGEKVTYNRNIQKEIKENSLIKEEKKSESDSDTLERQFDNENDRGNLQPGRTKNFPRTLSSLVEETSSVMENSAEKVNARSVEELKTIFEKKPEAPGISEIEETQRPSNKFQTGSVRIPGKMIVAGTSRSKEIPGKMIGVEEMAGTSRSKEIPGKMIGVEEMAGTSRSKEIPGKMISVEEMAGTSRSKEIPGKMIGVEEMAGTSRSKETVNTTTPAECSSLPKGPDLTLEEDKLQTPKGMKTQATNEVADSDKRIQNSGLHDTKKNPELLEECSAQKLSQIDVIKPSEIYSNTSIYLSTSEDRLAKFTKARTAFEPMTLDDEEASKTSGKNEKCSQKLQEQELNSETNVRGNRADGGNNQETIANEDNKFVRGQQITKEHSVNNEQTSSGVHEQNGNNEISTTHEAADQKVDPKTEDTSKPTETKQWLMDVIPKFSKHTRFHRFRPQKPVCMRAGADPEDLRSRQEAVKPVFKFLKRQREMEVFKKH